MSIARETLQSPQFIAAALLAASKIAIERHRDSQSPDSSDLEHATVETTLTLLRLMNERNPQQPPEFATGFPIMEPGPSD